MPLVFVSDKNFEIITRNVPGDPKQYVRELIEKHLIKQGWKK